MTRSDFNVNEYYKELEVEAIIADLDRKRNQMVTICMNLSKENNKASVIRNNNAFMGKEVWLVGAKRFDPRGAVGTHHYETIKHTTDWRSLFAELRDQGYMIVGVDNIPGAYALRDCEFINKIAFVYGEERLGLSEDMLDNVDMIVYIEQGGSVRSINVAVASGIIMHAYNAGR